ncbi:MAG: protein kinase [Caldimonas sp.]
MSPVTDLDDAPTVIAPGDPLADGTRLRDYEIQGLVVEGAYNVVYAGWDHSLQRKVAIKEYLPSAIASRLDGSASIGVRSERHVDAFKAGMQSFVNEARLLARFDHPSLVKVYRFWEENGTAYMVMPFYEGPTLKAALAQLDHVPGESELRTWLKPVLNALTVLHDGQIWHQNIAPDEIMLTPMGPVLLGFCAAGHAIEGLHHTPAVALQAGFAAIEQYGSEAGTTRGPWTDLYALAAVVYTAIAGSEPAPAPARLVRDTLQPLSQVAAGLYGEGFLAAIDAALAVQPGGRPADHLRFRALMGDIDAPDEPVSLAPRRDLMQEPFLGDADGPPEITVPDRPLLAGAAAATSANPGGAVETRLRRPLAAPPVPEVAAADRPARLPPSWMKGGAGNFSKRALYGLVAVTFACIGIVALALQFYLRPTVEAPAAAASTASVAAVVAASAPPTATVPTPALPSPSVVPAATSTAAPPQPPVTGIAPPATAAERQALCIDILQKASLERISAGETDYFKRECK